MCYIYVNISCLASINKTSFLALLFGIAPNLHYLCMTETNQNYMRNGRTEATFS